MKNLIMLFALIASFNSYAQDTESKEAAPSAPEVSFKIIENVPIYKGCDENMPNSELKKCMNSQINNLVATNFNTDVAKNNGIPNGKVRINVSFKINPEGDIIEINAKSKYPILEQEAKRVVSLIPKFQKPGFQKGVAVTVPYYLPIVFMVDNKTKKKRK